MNQLDTDRLHLMLQLVMKIAKKTIPRDEFNTLCDDYGHWEDDKYYISGEPRNDSG